MKKNLIIIENKNFTDINFQICFPIKKIFSDGGFINLLPNILIKLNSKYPSEKEFQKEKLKRNISGFGCRTYSCGGVDFVRFSMQVVDPKYIEEDKIEEAFEFLMDTIYSPKITNNLFDENLYEKEYKKLEQDIIVNNNDIRFRAYTKALSIIDDLGYIKNSVFIDNSLLKNISNKKLYKYYKEQIYDNNPIMFVFGDVDKTKIEELYNKYILKNNKRFDFKNYYNKFLLKKDTTVKEIEEIGDFHQSVLINAYKIENMKEEDKILLYVIVSLFSSQSSGLLRKNLRDDSGLVYSVKSQLEYSAGLIVITALINSETMSFALKQIEAAFSDIKNKETIEPLLKNIVERSRLNLLWNLDDKKIIMDDNITELLGNGFNEKEKYEKLKKINSNDVINFVDRIKLDLIYFLKGEANEK